ncbi:MAG: flagellar biosynthesis protein FlhB [Solirubrobacteraceae bacterium]|jgi:flagellar biosynthetic protein FlhB|nr:flagellar biosynthesis protein FlhB [Solirubrobacteraceae bacterium]
MSAGADKTEKATPKHKSEARKKGQVAKSADLNGAIVLIAALFALTASAPRLVETLMTSLHECFTLISTPGVVDHRGLGRLVSDQAKAAGLAAAPVMFVCLMAGLLANIAQVGGKPHPQALKPDPKKLNPLQGAKQIFGKNALFEGAKNLVKVSVVAVVAIMAVLPKLDEFAGLVGLPPAAFMTTLASTIVGIAWRCAMAYLVIGAIDYIYQRFRHEKSLKMSKEDVKQEGKGQDLPPEVRGAMRRRQMEAARARMMADVPQADVVVTNPTHYAVALRYDAEKAAPQVVAKGADLVARRIREIAAETGIPVIQDPPLARSLHASVEVGQLIPEELYQAVAQLLAFVYRTARRKVAA